MTIHNYSTKYNLITTIKDKGYKVNGQENQKHWISQRKQPNESFTDHGVVVVAVISTDLKTANSNILKAKCYMIS